MSGTRKFDPWAAIGKPNPMAATISEAEERRLDAAVEYDERQSIVNEPALPPPGSEERKVIDLRHERIIRSLMTVSKQRC